MTPKEAAEWANIAYENEIKGCEWAADRGFSYTLFRSGPHQCVFASKGDDCIIAIRGTQFSEGRLIERFRDFWTNAKMNQVECNGAKGKVHKGYHKGTWELIRLVMPLVRDRRQNLVVLGHSMGGVMAIIMGAILRAKAVYSFNAPKPGDKDFADNYPVNIFRFVSDGDFAEGIPSSVSAWHHAGPKIQLPSKGHSIDKILALWP